MIFKFVTKINTYVNLQILIELYMKNKLFFLIPFALIIISCSGREIDPTSNPIEIESKISENDSVNDTLSDSVKSKKINSVEQVNIYIQNTGGMYGYLHETEFKDILTEWIGELKSMLNHEEDKIKVFSINDKIIQLNSPTGIIDSPLHLTESNLKNKGSIQTTDMYSLIQKAIENSSDNTISILITDGIVSKDPGLKQDTSIFLRNQRVKIKDAVDEASKNRELRTNIYKYKVRFNGAYYTYEKPFTGTTINTNRPFYIFAFGSPDSMFELDQKMSLSIEKDSNFHDSFKLTNTSYNDDIDIKVLQTTERGPEQFAIAADFSKIPVSDDYLESVDFYETSSNKIRIQKVSEIKNYTYESSGGDTEQVKPGDRKLVSNATHILIIEAPSTILDFDLSLSKRIPDWIANSTTDNDSAIATDPSLQDKTFGFSSIIDGIFDAYSAHEKGKTYFNHSIQINQATKNNNNVIWIILGLGVVVVGVIWVIKEKSNSN